ncbi:MAG TPA: hypothetical protein VIN58_15170 [Roseateles sp.]
MNSLTSIQHAAELIRQGRSLTIAGPEDALDQLPQGSWIGGTCSYFMLPEGGRRAEPGEVFVTDLTDLGRCEVRGYAATEVARIHDDAPGNGFSFAIVPADSEALTRFASDAPSHPLAFERPVVGWVAGVRLEDIGQARAKVVDGSTGRKSDDLVAIVHVSLPAERWASIDIVNLFEAEDGDVLTFEDTGMHITHCLVNGERTDFAAYVRDRGLGDGRRPLVGDFAGAAINASIQRVGEGYVDLYAPVFPKVEYRFSQPVNGHAQALREKIAAAPAEGQVLSCNCILNYVHGELEGKAVGGIAGPMTFGEIGYQLLNQTFVTLRVL